jgi:hypothetical protein
MIKGESMRYLRDKSGFIYEWNEILAANKDCEEVTEQEAYPENFVPEKQKGRKTKVDLGDTEVQEAPQHSEELAAEASKGL